DSPANSPGNRFAQDSAPNNVNSPFRAAVFQAGAQQAGDAQAADDTADQEGEDQAGGAGLIGETDIQFVEELGVAIIKGNARDVQRVLKIIEEIKTQAEVTQPDIRVRQLQHADSNAVASLLQQLYEDVLSARQGEVNITALDTPNALLLIGREEAIGGVLDLIEKIDQPVPETDRLRVFRLQHASAIDAEETIRGFFTANPGADDDARPGLGIRVRISADYRTNSLIVSAAPRDMSEVTRLINELDVQEITSQSQIRVFPLQNAIAEDLAPTLQSAIGGDDAADDQVSPRSTTLSMVTSGSNGEQMIDSGILAGAVVTADNNSNALVIRAPASSMPLIAELVRQLDRAPGLDTFVKVFTLENSDATTLAQSLETLFGSDAATTGTAVGAGNLQGLVSSTASESSLVPLRFSTDIRTNSIVASGSSEDLEVVESLLLRLDSDGFAERITEVVWLRNQTAADVAAALQDYVSQRQTGLNNIQQFQQGGLGVFDLPDRDLIVVPTADFGINSLLISVSPRIYPEVRRLIDDLDRRPPMILVKTVVAEVSLDDRFEIGGEVGLQDSLLFDRDVAGGAVGNPPYVANGFNFNQASLPNINGVSPGTVAARGVSTFGVGTSSTAAGVGGFVLNAASESVNLLFRTLQTAGRLQVISRPQIETLDNNEAVISVGQQVARPTEVVVNQNNTAIGVEEIDVGLILRVTPRVGADGMIVMNIDVTRSAVNNTDPGQVIGFFDGGPVEVPPIDKIQAQSRINAFNGQTVVFAGLITKQRENVTRRLPYVSNIPVLGYFFKFDQEIESRTELLIAMTPMIVSGEQDLEYVKLTESSRMSWCLADVVEAHGDVGFSGGYGLWGPAVGNTIYPDMQPTVDDIQVLDDRVIGEEVIHDGAPMMESGVVPQSSILQSPEPTISAPAMPVTDGAIMESTGMLNDDASRTATLRAPSARVGTTIPAIPASTRAGSTQPAASGPAVWNRFGGFKE
ncbi:MAG: secretin N-terminal domain-containing protein, partial [Planctomycetota bacterium]